jgi:ribosomal protein S7
MDIEGTMGFILEQLAQASAQLTRVAALQERTDRRLDRAIRLAVREARQERDKRREMDERLDEKIRQLAAAQLVTEEKFQRFLDSQRGTNGKG